MNAHTPKILVGSKKTTSDMGFGTNSMISGLSFGLMGKVLNLYSDRTWEVVDKKGKVFAEGDEKELLGIKNVTSGIEVTFSTDKSKRWLRIEDSSGVLPWMGNKSTIDSLEGLIHFWRFGDHSKRISDQKPVSSPVKYLGGTGSSLQPESLGTLWITPTGFAMKSREIFWFESVGDLVGVQIGGVGIYTTGGGWVGGGVGFNGAMKGAAMASMMNALETRVHNDCLLRLSFTNAELNFQILDITPRDLELLLAPIRLHLERQLGVTSSSTMGLSGTVGVATPNSPGKDLKSKLEELKRVFDEGLITQDEYDSKRANLLDGL